MISIVQDNLRVEPRDKLTPQLIEEVIDKYVDNRRFNNEKK